jgi:UDP-2-acetamido-3-amino-2,3-dideoxy-glucuronate N-acetyltransferase
MSRHGIRLPKPGSDGIMICAESGYRYKEVKPGVVRCLDLDENAPLPPDKAVGKLSYDQLKKK